MSSAFKKVAVFLLGTALVGVSWAGISTTLNTDASGGEKTATFSNGGATLKVNRLTDAPVWLTEAQLEPAGTGNSWVNLLEASGSSTTVTLHFTVSANTTGSERTYSVKVLAADNSVHATVTIKQSAGTGTGSNENLFGFPPAAYLKGSMLAAWQQPVIIRADMPSGDGSSYDPISSYVKGQQPYVHLLFANRSSSSLSGRPALKMEILNSSASVLYTGNSQAASGTIAKGQVQTVHFAWDKLAALDVGSYVLRLTWDPQQTTSDGDRSDNVATYSFSVVTSDTPSGQSIRIAFHSNDSHNWNFSFSGFTVGEPLGNPSGLTSITGLPGFLGWFTASGAAVSGDTLVTEDMTDLYAHWESTPEPPEEQTAVEKLFGVGQASEFMVGANEKAFVVGVSGLTWCDFALRAYKGQGWQDADKAGQSFYCFDDSRIMDVEKLSSLTSIDHDWCGLYAEMQALLWGGYVSGYSNEDTLADFLRGKDEMEAVDAFNALVTGNPAFDELPTGSPERFVGALVNAFAGCDARAEMCVMIDHQSGEREAAAHFVSLVGYSLDTTKSPSDPAALRGLFVIDSDNDMYDGKGGTSAPNSITYCPVSYESYGGSALMGLPAGKRFVIRNVFGTWGLVDLVAVVRARTAASVNKTVSLEWPISCSDPGSEIMEVDVPVVEPSGAFAVPKATTQSGVLIRDGAAVGVLQVKVGKESKGESKVSVTVIGLDGKKYTAKAVKVPTGDISTATFEVKNLGKLTLTFGANGFSGTLDGAVVTSVAGRSATTAGAATFVADDLSSLPGVLTDYLPADEKVTRTEKKWKVEAKAGKLKYVKPNEKKRIAGGLQATGSNIAGLKLTYAVKTQTFKGSFKVWTFDESKNKLKSVSAKVTGIVVNGTGYGVVTVKKAVIGELTVK